MEVIALTGISDENPLAKFGAEPAEYNIISHYLTIGYTYNF